MDRRETMRMFGGALVGSTCVGGPSFASDVASSGKVEAAPTKQVVTNAIPCIVRAWGGTWNDYKPLVEPLLLATEAVAVFNYDVVVKISDCCPDVLARFDAALSSPIQGVWWSSILIKGKNISLRRAQTSITVSSDRLYLLIRDAGSIYHPIQVGWVYRARFRSYRWQKNERFKISEIHDDETIVILGDAGNNNFKRIEINPEVFDENFYPIEWLS